jgi:hypothetical protein
MSNTPNTDKVKSDLNIILQLVSIKAVTIQKAVDTILQIKELHVEAESQELPKRNIYHEDFSDATEAMIGDNFIKCELKEGK